MSALSRNRKPPNIPNSRPKVSGVPFNVAPNLFDIQRIKEEATAEAVRRLEEKLQKSEAELQRLQIEAYNEALNDAEEYITVMACRAISNLWRYKYNGIEKFLDELMRLMAEADIAEERKWLEDLGFKLVLTDVGDEVKKGGPK